MIRELGSRQGAGMRSPLAIMLAAALASPLAAPLDAQRAGQSASQRPADSASVSYQGVPPAVKAALLAAPLAEGDGAILVRTGRDTAIVAVGTGVADSVRQGAPCMVARLRAQRELARMIAGSHLESRIEMSASEQTGALPRQRFDERIAEAIEARIPGAALAGEWWLGPPRRCRVALWVAVARARP